jgi:hypothetical protein
MNSGLSYLSCSALLVLSACSDSPAEARAKNEKYLDRLAKIVCDYHTKKQKLPESFDDALSASGQMLPHRGDYYAKHHDFLQFQDTAFCFRASNAEVSYVNCKKVPRAVFVDWVRTHSSPDEWEYRKEFYDR